MKDCFAAKFSDARSTFDQLYGKRGLLREPLQQEHKEHTKWQNDQEDGRLEEFHHFVHAYFSTISCRYNQHHYNTKDDAQFLSHGFITIVAGNKQHSQPVQGEATETVSPQIIPLPLAHPCVFPFKVICCYLGGIRQIKGQIYCFQMSLSDSMLINIMWYYCS